MRKLFVCRHASKRSADQLSRNSVYLLAFCIKLDLYTFNESLGSDIVGFLVALFHCMVRHGTVRYGSLLGGFPLGTVPGT